MSLELIGVSVVEHAVVQGVRDEGKIVVRALHENDLPAADVLHPLATIAKAAQPGGGRQPEKSSSKP